MFHVKHAYYHRDAPAPDPIGYESPVAELAPQSRHLD